LLKYPEEVDEFIKNPQLKFGILDEFNGQPWQHGAMQKKGVKEAPFVNAGFLFKKPVTAFLMIYSERKNGGKKISQKRNKSITMNKVA